MTIDAARRTADRSGRGRARGTRTEVRSVRGQRIGQALGGLGLHVAAIVLVLALVAASTQGLLFAVVAVAAAAFVVVLALLGTDRTGMLLLVAAYATAPMYKGLAPSPASIVTPTDLLLVAGFGLLALRLVGRRLELPPLYLLGVLLVLSTGLVASILSEDSVTSFVALGFWMIVMFGLPVAIALWGPSPQVVDWLAWAFVTGQVFSMGYGLVQGSFDGRYAGLSTHPNYLAQSGVMSLALLIYLFYRHHGRMRLVVLAAAGVCAASVFLSGSRAATVVAAVLVLMIPIVERSAVKGFLLALLGGVGIFALPLFVDLAGEGSSIARLGGDQTAQFSDSARSLGLEAGLARFAAHPLSGDGLIDLFDIHNNFLEVLVGIGLFGLVGYLLVLYTFARPLFGRADNRRLAYVVWAYVGFGATVPSLYDRSVWAVVALSVVAMVSFERSRREPVDPVDPDEPTTSPPPPLTEAPRLRTRSGVSP